MGLALKGLMPTAFIAFDKRNCLDTASDIRQCSRLSEENTDRNVGIE